MTIPRSTLTSFVYERVRATPSNEAVHLFLGTVTITLYTRLNLNKQGSNYVQSMSESEYVFHNGRCIDRCRLRTFFHSNLHMLISRSSNACGLTCELITARRFFKETFHSLVFDCGPVMKERGGIDHFDDREKCYTFVIRLSIPEEEERIDSARARIHMCMSMDDESAFV